MNTHQKTLLTSLFQCGVKDVLGKNAVKRHLDSHRIPRPSHVLSVGKAAVSMFKGLPGDWQDNLNGLIVTKDGHIGETVFSPSILAMEASHPVPSESSLRAGSATLDFVKSCAHEDRLLMLVSGGSSSLVEVLEGQFGLDDLQAITNSALLQGDNIEEINAKRRQLSAVKGGKLLEEFAGIRVDVLAISDVEGDSIDVIGSGIGQAPDVASFDYYCAFVASNSVARMAIADSAESHGLKVADNSEELYSNIEYVADNIFATVADGPSGLYIFGGEPTIELPINAGRGGRNQALALTLAKHFAGNIHVCGLVAGTDGSDGPTTAAGGFFDGGTFAAAPGAQQALEAADTGTYLELVEDLFVTGPTGTNVMDIALILKL